MSETRAMAINNKGVVVGLLNFGVRTEATSTESPGFHISWDSSLLRYGEDCDVRRDNRRPSALSLSERGEWIDHRMLMSCILKNGLSQQGILLAQGDDYLVLWLHPVQHLK